MTVVQTCALPIFTENALQIFVELGFIIIDTDKLSFGHVKKNELKNSPTHCRLSNECENIYKIAEKNIRCNLDGI